MDSIVKNAVVVICTTAAAYLSVAFIAWDMGWVATADPFIRAFALATTIWLSSIAIMVLGE